MPWTELPPGLILLLGGVLAAISPRPLRQALMLGLPVLGFWQLTTLQHGSYATASLFGMELVGSRIDALSLVWGYIFYIAAFGAALFHLHVRDRMQDVAALTYMGSAIGAVFAGDLMTLFIYWELTAITSVFLVFANRTDASFRAGIRYLIVQIASGVLLMGGLVLYWRGTGSLAFGQIGLDAPGGVMILLGFGIKAAFPLFHAWLPDAYSRATPTGTVFLSSFTTKMAIYTLARGFPGAEELVWIGVVMVLFTLVLAALENDLRRVLAYCLNNQLGFMVVSIGIGTELALNGAAAQAFAHILYKGLLFMVVGSVLTAAGTAKASELGGLARSMPWTATFGIIAAAAISTPFFCGFVSKSLILSAVAKDGSGFVWGVLLFASAGVFLVSGVRVVHAAFFAAPATPRAEPVGEAPWNMRLAMAFVAALCIAVGVMPGELYAILPYAMDYDPYTASHILTQFQLLAFSVLAYFWLRRLGLWPADRPVTVLDVDAIYRGPLHRAWRRMVEWGSETSGLLTGGLRRWVEAVAGLAERLGGPQGIFGGATSTGNAVVWLTALLGLYLLIFVA